MFFFNMEELHKNVKFVVYWKLTFDGLNLYYSGTQIDAIYRVYEETQT